MSLCYIPLLVRSRPVIFGMVDGKVSQKDKASLLEGIKTAGDQPVSVILFSSDKYSEDTEFRLSNGRKIQVLGQRGDIFEYALTRSPTLRKILRYIDTKEEV